MKPQESLEIEGKNVLLVGVRGLQNFGDELILLGNIKLLQRQNKKIFIVSQNTNRLKVFLSKEVDCSNIVFIEELPRGFRSFFRFLKKREFKQLKLFLKIDTIILGGGEILTEETKISYYYRLCSIWPSLFFKKKLYIMGGVQVPKKRINRFLFNRILNHTQHVYCRDFESIESLKKIGFSKASFFMDTSFFSRDNRKKYKHLKPKKYVVININKNGLNFIDDLKKILKEYINMGYKCYYIPVSNGGNDTQDEKILKKRMIPIYLKNTENDLKYLSELKRDFSEIEVYDRTQNLEEFFNFLGGAEIVISTRLHLFLISEFIGLKTKVFPYQKKIIKMQKVINSLQVY